MIYLIATILFLTNIVNGENETYYDAFAGKTITPEEFHQHIKENTTFWCTGKYKACDPDEPRRLDETCNNLRYPTRGPIHTPYMSELPLIFDKNNNPVKMSNGDDFHGRKIRASTLINGDIPDQKFTILVAHYLLFLFATVGSIHDTLNYVTWKPYCCAAKGRNDSQCYPISIPADDTVHQFSDINCFNFTKPITYQTVGCIKDKSTTPQRINTATTFLDLEKVYTVENSRTFKDGLLKVEEENEKIWPISRPAAGICLQNQLPRETRCHADPALNSLFGINFFGIVFWRNHNFIAKHLRSLNPCWDDDKLFFTARNINIAIFNQILYYEMLPPLIGENTLLREGIISRDGNFRDLYQPNIQPKMSLEFAYVMRWPHTIHPGQIEMYDSDGNYLSKIPVSNLTLRTGWLPIDNNMEKIMQASFRQPSGKFDHVVDPVMSETGLSGLQRAFDILAADLLKGGLFGLQLYTAYRKLCTGRNYTTFEDLRYDVEPENIEIMKRFFPRVEDVPLMVGIWLEKKIPGGEVPRTFACLFLKQMKRFMQYDRFWYESSKQPNPFTKSQLQQIRMASLARLLCDVGDSVKRIQPFAFLREQDGNKIISCSNIRSIDFSAWKDSTCQ